jgi:hypothetical protein
MESGCLSVRLSVCRRNSFRALECYPYHLESPYHAYGLPMGGKCSLFFFRSKGQRSSALDIKVEIWFLGSRYPYHLQSPYHTYRLPMRGRCSLSNLGSKRWSALDIEVEIWFQGSRVLLFPLRDTISHIWTTHGRKMFPIKFAVQRSSALDIEVEIQGSRVLLFPLRDTVSHIWTTHKRKMIPIEFGVERS